MKAKSVQAFLAALLATGAAVSVAGCSLESSAQSEMKAQRWEYTILNVDGFRTPGPDVNLEDFCTKATTAFNKLGVEGWEYAGDFFVGRGSYYSAVFKRLKRSP